MRKFVTNSAIALAAVSFSAVAAAQTEGSSNGMSAEEHQQMMSSGDTSNAEQTMSVTDMHRRMTAMMERCADMMSKTGKHASLSGSNRASAKETSGEGEWAWRPDPRQASGPRASLRPPIRVWVPAEKSLHQ